jgi:hypothetical protein
MSDPSGGSSGLAVQDASPRAVARYLAQLKPVLTQALSARAIWLRELKDLREREDLGAAQPEAVQVALGQAQQFNEARRQLSVVPVPQNCQEMHRSLDTWLRGMAGSCEAIVKAKSPLTQESVGEGRTLMREASQSADKFNDERALVVAQVQEAAGQGAARPKIVANSKEMRAAAAGLIAALFVVGAMVYALNAFGGSSPEGAVKGIERRVFRPPDILTKLKEQIDARKVIFLKPDLQLVEPDKVLVTGQIPASEVPLAGALVSDQTKLIDVSVTLKIAAVNGKPKVTVDQLTGAGVTVPGWATVALSKRVDEGNTELAKQLKPTEWLQKLDVEKDPTDATKLTIVAEIATIDPNKPPPPAGP